jgi:outer membrane lipoprotein-sorting protein
MIKNNVVAALCAAVLAIPATQLHINAQPETAKEIADAVYNRSSPSNGESDMQMTLTNKKGSERVRALHQYFIDMGEVEKQIMFFTAPADVRNTSFMNWAYSAENQGDDQWLYLPALKKVKRISNSGKDNEFMGSDFTYEDMEKRSPERDVHVLIGTETIDGEEVWLVEATPVEEEQYARRRVWISKSRLLPLRVEFFDEDNEPLKTLTIVEAIEVKGYWVVSKQLMSNTQRGHTTMITLTNVQVENGTEEGRFTQRMMERGL